MSRDHRKLRVFVLADDLALEVYRITAGFPRAERFGLQAQLRRASLSAASNIVEGCARKTTREYASFINIAIGSSAEAQYLLELSVRLGLLRADNVFPTVDRYSVLLRGLKALVNAMDRRA